MTLLATSAVDSTLLDSIRLIVPEASLVGVACVLFVLSTLRSGKELAGGIALFGLGLAALLHFSMPRPEGMVATVSPLLGDHFATFIRLTSLATGALLLLISWHEPGERRSCDYAACLLCAVAGFSLTGAANDLVFLFLALELISIPTYVMLYLPGQSSRLSQEAAIKYFLLSIMSSAMLLFGFSYFYGLTGTTNIRAILTLLPTALAGDASNLAVIAAVMVIAGLGFRITAFPFHFYAPDVYQGAPLGVVSLLSFAPKLAGFAALLRLFGTIGDLPAADYAYVRQYTMLVWILAAVTMTAGNVLALLQNNVRRMFAYSGVAQGGYMLIGLAVIPAAGADSSEVISGASALLFYLVAYGAMTMGAFAVITNLDSPRRTVQAIDDLGGLHETNPRLAFALAIFLFGMIGLPLTGGFIGKFYLFLSALSVRSSGPMGSLYQALVIIAIINSAVSAYYYLRVVGVMYLRGAFQTAIPEDRSPPLYLAVGVCAALTVLFGVYPAPLLNAARQAFGG